MGTTARALVGVGILVCSLLAHAQQRPSQEWLTWGGDIERTGWNRAESALSKRTVGQLALKWKTRIDKQVSIEIESGASMLTGPLVAQGVPTRQGTKTLVYTLSAANTLAALDAGTGAIVWQRTIENTVEPANPANWICTNTSTATPVIVTNSRRGSESRSSSSAITSSSDSLRRAVRGYLRGEVTPFPASSPHGLGGER